MNWRLRRSSNKNKNKCKRCRCKTNLTKHHIIPRVYHDSGVTICLCRACHDKIEAIIAAAEELARGYPSHNSYRLPNLEYREIARLFTHRNVKRRARLCLQRIDRSSFYAREIFEGDAALA